MAKCPFLDPNFDLEIDEPCPVCGDLGNWCDDASKCVGDKVDAGDDLHQILGVALAHSPAHRAGNK